MYFILRPDAEKKLKSFDWTFTTDYKGTLSDEIVVEPTDETINYDLLKQKEQILFYHDLTLFEDELHDHGISKLSVKIVSVMSVVKFVNVLLFFCFVNNFIFVMTFISCMLQYLPSKGVSIIFQNI